MHCFFEVRSNFGNLFSMRRGSVMRITICFVSLLHTKAILAGAPWVFKKGFGGASRCPMSFLCSSCFFQILQRLHTFFRIPMADYMLVSCHQLPCFPSSSTNWNLSFLSVGTMFSGITFLVRIHCLMKLNSDVRWRYVFGLRPQPTSTSRSSPSTVGGCSLSIFCQIIVIATTTSGLGDWLWTILRTVNITSTFVPSEPCDMSVNVGLVGQCYPSNNPTVAKECGICERTVSSIPQSQNMRDLWHRVFRQSRGRKKRGISGTRTSSANLTIAKKTAGFTHLNQLRYQFMGRYTFLCIVDHG